MASNSSPWLDDIELPRYAQMQKVLKVDACVVGGGVTGLSTAYALAQSGQSVAVLDRARVGGRQTLRTTGHLTAALDTRYHLLEQIHGEPQARLVAESQTQGLRWIEETIAREGIHCDFERVDGYLFGGPDELLDRELEAARRAGLRVEMVASAPQFASGRAIRFFAQAQLHPGKYMAGLCAALERRGVHLFGDTVVDKIEDGQPVIARTMNAEIVRCDSVTLATNSPVNDKVVVHSKQAPYSTFVVALELPQSAPMLAWDTENPYHYLRTDGRLLLVGGEDHKSGRSPGDAERYDRLEQWARERFPSAGRRLHAWSGQVFQPVDGLPFIGRNARDKYVYLATGAAGNGLTFGAIAGMLISDLILERKNPWIDLYKPSRISVSGHSLKEYVHENLGVVRALMENVTAAEVGSRDEIAPGQGAIVRDGLRKLAVYRDELGLLHEYAAQCTHTGCIVHWNAGEREWHCPCHGSRFSALGQVLDGPAITDMFPHVKE